MDLDQRVGNAYRTGGVDVESYEDKRAMVVSSVLTDIFPLHSSHISAERDWCTKSGAGAQPPDLCVNDRTVEIADFGWIIDLGKRYRYGWQWIVMNQEPERRRAAGNGFGFSSLRRRSGKWDEREFGRYGQARCTCGRTQESAAREVPGVGVEAAKVLVGLSP